MIVKNAKYELTAVRPDQYPVNTIPEVAFVGRSNVGKSSIINSLLNRKNLARVGATPGKTRELNFYNVDEVLYFVDLPGYGYASVSKGRKSSWGEFIETYLSSRGQLKMLIMLVDVRHLPSNDDKVMYEWIAHSKLPHIVVATKIDKIPRSQLQAKVSDIRKTLQMNNDIRVIPFSSVAKQGKDDVWSVIDGVLGIGE